MGSEHFRIRAHPAALDRVETFLDLLVAAVQARGWRFEPGKDGLDALVDDERIDFTLTQTIARVRHEATPEETRAADRWDARHRGNARRAERPTPPWWDWTPTGEMRLEIDSWVEGVQRRFADTRARRLETRIGDILAAFAGHAAGRKVARDAARERERLAELERC